MSVPVDQMGGLTAAVEHGINTAGTPTTSEKELAEVRKLRDEYKTAREFDRPAREQYAKDRMYAQGRANPNWASDANLIGSFIDILVSFLYAQDPDVSVRPAPRAGMQPTKDAHDFAETLQIVVSRLWKDAKLKRTMRRLVRSALSVGVGWMKVLVHSETKRNPEIEKEMHDIRDNLEQIEALKSMLGDEYDGSKDEVETELRRQLEGLEANVEILVKRGLSVDFVRAEDVQVSLDVADITDHLDADWNSNDLYIRKSTLRARFPRLDEDDIKAAEVYHQRQPDTGTDVLGITSYEAPSPDGPFTKGTSQNGSGDCKAVEFVKVVELWDHRDNLIKTFVDGIHKWAVEPYPPPQASERFYPYYQLALLQVEGSRHPQSLTGRLMKLQDEYASARSNGRLTRERSVPGTVFNRGQLSPEDAKKLENSVHMEMVGINPTNPDLPLEKVIAQKPVPRVDPAIFDTGPVRYDMEVLSGVQEALQSGAASKNKTATQAEIEQSGFASRTGADRDTEEEMLNDLAGYTAQLLVQSLPVEMVQRIAGPLAYWPEGMDVQDILTMVDVEIRAGTTGKPQARADKESWATLMPLVQNMMMTVQQLELTNPPLAKGYRNLMRETLKRLDDRLDIDSIFPPSPPLTPESGAPLAVPPTAPPAGNGAVNNPGTVAPPPV